MSSEDSSTFKILVNKLIFMTSSRFREMYRRKSEPKRSGTESIYDEEHGSRLIWLVGKLFSVGALSSVLIMEFIDRLSGMAFVFFFGRPLRNRVHNNTLL